MNETKRASYSGYNDKNGKEICWGDIVRFYYDFDYGYYDENSEEPISSFTEMIDLIDYDKGQWKMVCDIGRAAPISQHNEYCEVIGNFLENPELIKSFPQKFIEETYTIPTSGF